MDENTSWDKQTIKWLCFFTVSLLVTTIYTCIYPTQATPTDWAEIINNFTRVFFITMWAPLFLPWCLLPLKLNNNVFWAMTTLCYLPTQLITVITLIVKSDSSYMRITETRNLTDLFSVVHITVSGIALFALIFISFYYFTALVTYLRRNRSSRKRKSNKITPYELLPLAIMSIIAIITLTLEYQTPILIRNGPLFFVHFETTTKEIEKLTQNLCVTLIPLRLFYSLGLFSWF